MNYYYYSKMVTEYEFFRDEIFRGEEFDNEN